MSASEASQTVLIQVDLPGAAVDMAVVRALLGGAGVEIDPDYGPIPINPALGRYVVRGRGTAAARRAAERLPGVRLFADARQRPVAAPKSETPRQAT
ncbi:MAG: hypothetical protein U0531_15125 [Dehalococcoidia bacterium]